MRLQSTLSADFHEREASRSYYISKFDIRDVLWIPKRYESKYRVHTIHSYWLLNHKIAYKKMLILSSTRQGQSWIANHKKTTWIKTLIIETIKAAKKHENYIHWVVIKLGIEMDKHLLTLHDKFLNSKLSVTYVGQKKKSCKLISPFIASQFICYTRFYAFPKS